MKRNDMGSHPERFSDRTHSPVVKLLVDVAQASVSGRGYPQKDIQEACQEILDNEQSLVRISKLREKYGITSQTTAAELREVSSRIRQSYLTLRQTTAGREQLFQNTYMWKEALQNPQVSMANEYIALKQGLSEFAGKNPSDLSEGELLDVQRKTWTTVQAIPSQSAVMFGEEGKFGFKWSHLPIIHDEDFAKLDGVVEGFEHLDPEVQAFMKDYVANAKMKLLATMVIDEFAEKDVVDGGTIMFKDYPQAWGGTPQTYKESLRFSRRLPEKLDEWVENGALDYTMPDYDFGGQGGLQDPASGLLAEMVSFMLPFGEENKAYKNYLAAAADADLRTRRITGDDIVAKQSAFTLLQKQLVEAVVNTFSQVTEHVHPKVEDKMRKVAIYMILGGMSSRFLELGKAYGALKNNPYDIFANQNLTLAESAKVLFQLAALQGIPVTQSQIDGLN